MRAHNIRYGGFQNPTGVVNGVGYLFDKSGYQEIHCTNRTVNAYVIVYLLEGGGMYEDETSGLHKVSAGDAILLFPGLKHTYHRVDENAVWSECWLEFAGVIFEDLERGGLISRQHPVIHPGLVPHLMAEMDGIIRDYQTAVPGEELIFAARSMLFLVKLVEAHRQAGQGEGDRTFLTEACARLQASLERTLQISDVARSFELSMRTFRRRFVEQAGMAPARYRVLQRIAAARTLLTETNLPLSTVAERLGYCDVQFFSKQFKQITGSTPAQFRDAPEAAALPDVSLADSSLLGAALPAAGLPSAASSDVALPVAFPNTDTPDNASSNRAVPVLKNAVKRGKKTLKSR